ncbi:MAG: alanine--glyoxylate aminotransferase family protein [Deltaproteobacteria bacterium]|nr:alanine--glyoxylate aminotransferase family protein [Deltaproteobacteria bacterium]
MSLYKYRLLAPGPTPVPEKVLTHMAEPIIHHRTAAFEAIVAEVKEGLKWLYQTTEEVLIFAASGTGAMEGAVINVMSKGDKALVVDSGKFGERWWKIAKAYGLSFEVIQVEWGKAVDPKIIAEKLAKEDYRTVMITASETSTGVAHPVKEIAEIVKKYDSTVLIVDAITGLGVFDLPCDKWGLDIVVSGSQKALMLPPGLAFASISAKAWKLIDKSDIPKFYFDFKKEKKAILENTTAYTPAVSLVIGLNDVLKSMKAMGLEGVFKKHQLLGSACREGLKAMGLKLFAPEHPSNAVTAVYSPEGIDAGKIVKGLRDGFNMTIAGGQDAAKGKIFRIGHLGYYDPMDMVSVLAAIEITLHKNGYKLELGKGVGAALKVIAECK